MFRFALVPAVALLAAPGCLDPVEDPAVTVTDQALDAALAREHVAGDVFHYTFTLRVGTTPNARIRLHRIVREVAPWRPRATPHGAMLMHGDFATALTNFAPSLVDPSSGVDGLAPYLAARDIDVWGLDRRWAIPTAPDADVSDFATMGVAQELDDLARALAFARAVRAVTGSGLDRLALIGFSHGAQLAYLYAALEGGRPAAQRHVRALAPIDIYAEIAPEDAELRASACANSAAEYDFVAQGFIDATNDFFIALGELDRSAPDDPTPFTFLGDLTNHEALLLVAGATYQLVPLTPRYHLAAPVIADGQPVGFRETSRAAVQAWFAGSPLHASMLESADLDALWCGSSPAPIDAPLSQVRVPVFYLGAAGAFGDHGLFTTTQLGSRDVTALVVRRFGPDRVAEDFGHGDLLFASDAPALAWQPLTAWLLHH